MNRFEHAIHTARRAEGELTTESLSAHWLSTQRDMFTDSVTLREDYGIWWSYVPHFLHTPGYVYAYSFGDLLVRALFSRYEAAGRASAGTVDDAARRRFADQYLAMLAAGGSDWPFRLVAPLGVDLADPGFWAQGLASLEDMVFQAEQMGSRA
jgi:oligoendopeptidase F